MNDIIIYLQDIGRLAVIHPTGDLPLEELARKDTPAGRPYILAREADLPIAFGVFFEAWEADFSNPDGYGIGPQAWFIEKYEAEIAQLNSTDPDSEATQQRVAELTQSIATLRQEMQQ